ncbi:MAG TPA: hypothetical protein D7H98_05725, partial [Candidatus Poseidoniales archaeon]
SVKAQANCLPIDSVSWVSMWPSTWPGELLAMVPRRISSERISVSVCGPESTNRGCVENNTINVARNMPVHGLFAMSGKAAGGK